MNAKLIFFDIDSTLVSHVGESHVPAATTEALRLLKEGGHTVAIATARNRSMTQKTAELLGIRLWVCCNGAHVSLDGRTLHEEYLNASFLRTFQEYMRSEHDNFWAIDADYVYTNRNDRILSDYITALAGFDCRRTPDQLQQACIACVFSPGLSPDDLRDKLHHEDVTVLSAPYGVEYLPRGVDKWSGILHAAEALDFSAADIIAVGDGSNDVGMLRGAAIGIAVAKSAPEAIKAADFVAPDIDEGGIMEAFVKLKMIRPASDADVKGDAQVCEQK